MMAKMFLRLVLYICIGFAHIKYADGRCCPNAWITFEESCYFFEDEKTLDWTEATHHCASLGGHLVTIESNAENLFLKDQVNHYVNHATSESFWMGATDEEVEGLWVWYTDHSVISKTFSDWQPGEPDDVGNQDCGCLYGGFKFTWGDCHCDYHCHMICEMEMKEDIPSVVG